MENKNTIKMVEPISTTIKNLTSSTMKIKQYPTNMKQLDAAINGGLSAGLYVLGAIPNIGKSTFALQIAKNLSASGVPVLFFSLEMSRMHVSAKLAAQKLFTTSKERYTSTQILNHMEEDSRLKSAVEHISDTVADECKNLYVYDRSYEISSAAHIWERVKEFCQTHPETGLPENQRLKNLVVIVDYLQILDSPTPGQKYRTDKTVVDENIAYFTKMSLYFPVLLISSFNRRNYNLPVSMEAFKESGSIEYSADVILGMQFSAVRNTDKTFNLDVEKGKNPREIDVVILKQRYGRSGGIPITFQYFSAHDCFLEAGASIHDELEDFDTLYTDLPILEF